MSVDALASLFDDSDEPVLLVSRYDYSASYVNPAMTALLGPVDLDGDVRVDWPSYQASPLPAVVATGQCVTAPVQGHPGWDAVASVIPNEGRAGEVLLSCHWQTDVPVKAHELIADRCVAMNELDQMLHLFSSAEAALLAGRAHADRMLAAMIRSARSSVARRLAVTPNARRSA